MCVCVCQVHSGLFAYSRHFGNWIQLATAKRWDSRARLIGAEGPYNVLTALELETVGLDWIGRLWLRWAPVEATIKQNLSGHSKTKLQLQKRRRRRSQVLGPRKQYANAGEWITIRQKDDGNDARVLVETKYPWDVRVLEFSNTTTHHSHK